MGCLQAAPGNGSHTMPLAQRISEDAREASDSPKDGKQVRERLGKDQAHMQDTSPQWSPNWTFPYTTIASKFLCRLKAKREHLLRSPNSTFWFRAVPPNPRCFPPFRPLPPVTHFDGTRSCTFRRRSRSSEPLLTFGSGSAASWEE